jgi:hypothetical protein
MAFNRHSKKRTSVRLERTPARQTAGEMACSEKPRLAILAMAHAIDETTELGSSDSDNVADLMGKALGRPIAILGRREQGAEK